jgi:hypothetical protein
MARYLCQLRPSSFLLLGVESVYAIIERLFGQGGRDGLLASTLWARATTVSQVLDRADLTEGRNHLAATGWCRTWA